MSKLRTLMAAATLSVAGLGGAVTSASAASVVNASFETIPSPISWVSCASVAHPTCQAAKTDIPGWQSFGAVGLGSGLFQTGGRSLVEDDGPTYAYSNGGKVQQLVGLSEIGKTYTLSVDIGYRKNRSDDSSVYLMVNGFLVQATTIETVNQFSGLYYAYSASITAAVNPADPSWNKIWVILDDTADRSCTRTRCIATGQGDWDNVRLTSSVPEPATWALMLVGFGAIGYAARRRSKAIAAA